jgi:hypothetical protein
MLKINPRAYRWIAEAKYKNVDYDKGIFTKTFEFDEIGELHDWVEKGPDWVTLENITITYNHSKLKDAGEV